MRWSFLLFIMAREGEFGKSIELELKELWKEYLISCISEI